MCLTIPTSLSQIKYRCCVSGVKNWTIDFWSAVADRASASAHTHLGSAARTICHLQSVICNQAQRGAAAFASATGLATKGSLNSVLANKLQLVLSQSYSKGPITALQTRTLYVFMDSLAAKKLWSQKTQRSQRKNTNKTAASQLPASRCSTQAQPLGARDATIPGASLQTGSLLRLVGRRQRRSRRIGG